MDRRAAALAWLGERGVAAVDAAAIVTDVLAVMEAPQWAPLFGTGALAEAPVAGLVGERMVSGTVDRLLVEDGRVLIVDFKTGAAVPETAEAVHPAHRRQMAAYHAVVARAFPDHVVEAGLLFTAAPKLVLLRPQMLVDALRLDREAGRAM
jgi:ATP-dependent helicase/nuclease subunit A